MKREGTIFSLWGRIARLLMVRSGAIALLLCCGGFVLLACMDGLPNGLRWPSRILGVVFAGVGLAGVGLAGVGLAGVGLAGVGLAGCIRASIPPLLSITEGLRDQRGRWDFVVVAILVVQHSLMLWNSAVHDRAGNPDWHRHWQSIEAWSRWHMLDRCESKAFYYPPLAYWPTAAAHALGLSRHGAIRLGMFLGVVYSMVSLFYMLRVCRLIAPASAVVRRMAVVFPALV